MGARVSSIVITGVNGFVGRRMAVMLGEAFPDAAIVGLDLGERASALTGPAPASYEYRRIDITDDTAVRELIGRLHPEVIVHLAGILSKDSSPRAHAALMDVNVRGTCAVCEAAAGTGAYLFFPSTGLVYGDQPGPYRETMALRPDGFYALSKLLCEELIDWYRRSGALEALVVRPSLIYGIGQSGGMFIPSLIDALVHGRPFPMTKGEQVRDFVYIDDFAAAAVAAIRRRASGTVNCASGTAHPLAEVARLAERVAGVRGLVRIGERAYREKESWDYRLDIENAARLLDWRPAVSLEQGMQRIVAFESRGVAGA
jgi:UDP-glucose 4-epimerase